jgi:indole-3-glycerol phosphate synthase
MSTSILNTISAHRAAAPRTVPLEVLQAQCAPLPPPPSFVDAFRGGGLHVIAELKKGSPSKGLIRADFHPCALAEELEAAGAVALSILTEPEYFLGSLEYLQEVHACVKIPLLRKDFIITDYQIYEARAAGASAILLIAALLTPAQFRALHTLAESLQLAVLCEAHSADEAAMLLDHGAKIIGVNARNLHDFSVSTDASLKIIATLPPSVIRIAESGLQNADDLRRFHDAGADGFLIGETLMRAPSPGAKLHQLMSGVD